MNVVKNTRLHCGILYYNSNNNGVLCKFSDTPFFIKLLVCYPNFFNINSHILVCFLYY